MSQSNLPDASRTAEDLDAFLGPGGAIARTLVAEGGTFEARPQQRQMAEAVLRALSSRRHLLAEAGTGVGKSFAYLVPALMWASQTGGRVAVATATIALQEQLVRKDLPLLARALPFPVKVALVKGRGNYVCLRRLKAAADDPGLLDAPEARREVQAIRTWAATTVEGSRQDLPFQPSEEVWDQVRAEAGNCLHKACPHYARCPYQRSRRVTEEASLLVLNHHVLIADLAMRRSGASFLPDIHAIVIDEAHDLEDTAAEHLGLKVSSAGVAQVLGRLWSVRGTGLLRRHSDARLRTEVERARDAMREFFGGVEGWLEGAASGGRAVRLEGGLPVEDRLRDVLKSLAARLALASESAGERDLALEMSARARGVLAAAETLERLAADDVAEEVRWAEGGARRGASLCSAPVDVGARLKEVLWKKFGTVVLTSATLAAGSPPSFSFLRSRLGLDDADEVLLGSPFDYARQARIVVRADLPDPTRFSASYDAALPEAILAAVRATRGGAFVLFTSITAMRAAAAATRAALAAEGIEVLVQGEGLERPAMLERFKATEGALFGVASFWQGVDVPGDALRHVVIARIPFEVPTHPIQEARSERLENEGRDPFSELSLPAAAIRLKQGFGRLIRRATDRGRVTILDSRIVTRAYGRFLLGSLPACPVEVVREGDEMWGAELPG